VTTGNLRQTAHTAFRIAVGFLFFPHGAQKIFGAFGGFGGTPGGHAPLLSLMGLAGVIECFGGLAIMIGIFTRPVAFVAAGEMASAFFLSHLPRGIHSLGAQGWWPFLNGGELAVLYCFSFLTLVATGGGTFSVDAWLTRRKSR
jgi:putative oxidoreductase